MGSRAKKNFIQGMNMHKGALHRSLHVPQNEKILAKKLAKASHSKNPVLRRRANLAKTLKSFHHADGGCVEKKSRGGDAGNGMSWLAAINSNYHRSPWNADGTPNPEHRANPEPRTAANTVHRTTAASASHNVRQPSNAQPNVQRTQPQRTQPQSSSNSSSSSSSSSANPPAGRSGKDEAKFKRGGRFR